MIERALTVSELIEALKTFPPDRLVVTEFYACGATGYEPLRLEDVRSGLVNVGEVAITGMKDGPGNKMVVILGEGVN